MNKPLVQTRTTDDGIFVITLDRPEKANAITTQMDLEWLHALHRAEADPAVRVVVQHGNGAMFTAGHDLVEVGGIIADLGADASDWSHVYARIWPEGSPLDLTTDMVTPTVSAVHGQVVGQGVFQVLATDLVIAAEGTIFNMEVARTGGAAGMAALSGLMPAKQINELAYTGRLTAEALLATGAINRVVPLDQLMPTAMELAATVASMHPDSATAYKRATHKTYGQRGISDFRAAFEDIKESHGNDDDNAFWARASTEGVKEALAWRDSAYGPKADA